MIANQESLVCKYKLINTNNMKTLKSSFIRIIAIGLLVFSIASCTKDEVTTSKTNLITGKTWVISSVNMMGMDFTAAEIIAQEGAEFQMVLNVDGTVKYMDNMGMNPMSGKWEFQQNETQFKVSGIDGTNSDLNTITQLSATDLEFWHMDGTDKMTMHYKIK
jgi:uncharacterized lipoprotein YehR (DUF1307 family)